MLTNDRAELLSKYLADDKERTEGLFALDPQEAAKKINADGYDFTAEELAEFGKQIKASIQGGEMSEDALDDVAGGCSGTGHFYVDSWVGFIPVIKYGGFW